MDKPFGNDDHGICHPKIFVIQVATGHSSWLSALLAASAQRTARKTLRPLQRKRFGLRKRQKEMEILVIETRARPVAFD